jgi:adenosylcobinamide-phosphate synthase
LAEPVATAALMLDAAIGWPAWLYARVGHPVGGFARLIDLAERRWNRADRSFAARRALGIVTMAALIALVAGSAVAIEAGVRSVLGSWAWVAVAVLAWPALAMRSLYAHVRPVAAALGAGDLPGARRAIAMIVGRDTDALVGGLPGVWAYKAINTADSLIGHREPRWRAFGWAAARIDDAANLVPARMSGVLICLAGAGGWGTMWRDCRRHASPNAGWPEAAMAGALGIALAGPVAYDGVWHDKPWIGAGGRAATARDVERALGVYRLACVLLILFVGGVAWLR